MSKLTKLVRCDRRLTVIGRRCTIEGLTNRTARSARLLELPEYLHKESLFFVQNSKRVGIELPGQLKVFN